MDENFTSVQLGVAEQGFHDFGSSGAHQAGKTKDLTAFEVEADILEHTIAGQAATAHDDLTDLGFFLREHLGDFTTDHPGDQLVARRVGRQVGTDILAVTQDGDFIGDLEDFVHFVRDENKRHILFFFQRPDHPEQMVNFLVRDGGSRLVHDDQLGVIGNRLGDFDHLLFGNGQFVDLLGR